MQTLTYSVQRGSRQRWMLLAVLLTIAALILSACGAKIETQLGLESADKGVRTMQVSFDLKDNQDKIKDQSDKVIDNKLDGDKADKARDARDKGLDSLGN